MREMRLLERIMVNGDGNLQIDMRIEDPVALREPWIAQRFYRKTDWMIQELMCMDNVTYRPFEDSVLEFETQ